MKTVASFLVIGLVAFSAGLLVSPLLRQTSTGSITLGAPSEQRGQSASGAKGRAHPFSSAVLPQSTEEFIERVREASRDTNSYRRMGKIWWLSEGMTSANAEAIVKGSLDGLASRDRVLITGVLFGSWGKVDPEAALAYAKKIDSVRDRDQATLGALAGWASNDFDAAQQWVAGMPTGSLKRRAEQALISALAENNPDRALEIATRQNKLRGDSGGQVYAIFSQLVSRDPERAAESAENLPAGRFRTQAMSQVARQWGQTDRAAALAWVDSLPENAAKRDIISGVLQEWVLTDFDGSLAWLEKMSEGNFRNRTVQTLLYSTASDNPENALRLVDLVTQSSSQDSMLSSIAQIWSRNDLPGAMDWARSQTDPSVQKAVWQGLVYGMAAEDPPRAAELALSLPQEQKRNLLANVANTWANQDPGAAAAWAQKLADPAIRQQSVGNVMASWVRDDPNSALKWFSSVPQSSERDVMLSTFLPSLGGNDPKLAIQWAQSMQDANLRRRQLEVVASSWMQSDPANAQIWIANSELEPAAKKRLIERPR